MTELHGAVFIDLISTRLSEEERELLQHPHVGGVVLFARNFESPQQINALCQDIRNARSNPILIAVDHEGGRVQRFQTGFTRLPAMSQLGKIYETSPLLAKQLSETIGWLIASELLAVGVDLSFAPVLDLNKEINQAIGNRAFHHNPMIVSELASMLICGMQNAGMAATGKHFPGHGSVKADSHAEIPIDSRCFADVEAEDLIPFQKLIHLGLKSMMPAHILFPEIDDKPVSFSAFWLKQILRTKLKFNNVIVSDDLNMQGASISHNYAERAVAAREAGCDMVLICNNRAGAIEILEGLPRSECVSSEKFHLLCGNFSQNHETLFSSSLWKEKQALVLKYESF